MMSEMLRCGNRLVVALSTMMAVAMIPSVASASEIDFLRVAHGASVSVSGVRSGTFMAGELDWRWIGTPPDGFAQSFYSYCIDVQHNLFDGQRVAIAESEDFTNGVVDGGSKVAWLFNTFAAGIRNNANSAQANIQAAALQVAIWEAMYDTAANLGSGDFRLNTAGSIRTTAESYLAALYDAGSDIYRQSRATVLEVVGRDPGQDQIVSKVSEPSTLLLAGVAFLLFARRARRSADLKRDEL